MSQGMRLRICLLATTLALAACGGSEGGASSTAGPDAPEVSTTVAPGSEAEEPAETTAPAGDSDGGDVREVDVSEATIVLGDETYLYTQEENGTCDPDFAGSFFRAFLTRVDENGDPMELPGMEGFTQGATFALALDGFGEAEDQTAISISGETEWFASPLTNEGSRVDSLTIDGNYAHGTATFVTNDGDGPVSGTFEIICAN